MQIQPWTFDFCAGDLAMNFANTVSERVSGSGPIERLPSYAELVRFARQAELVSKSEAKRLTDWGARHPSEAEKVQRSAIELREALYEIFLALAHERPIAEKHAAILNRWLSRRVLDANLTWTWRDGADAPDAFLAPILERALEVLTGPLRDRVSACGRETCQWVFLDTSKNRSRRWCEMDTCGNREKAKRFYERHH